jgi:hypothetical protein
VANNYDIVDLTEEGFWSAPNSRNHIGSSISVPRQQGARLPVPHYLCRGHLGHPALGAGLGV